MFPVVWQSVVFSMVALGSHIAQKISGFSNWTIASYDV